MMSGDLSLSQSFGGLRIANPDDASPSSNGTSRELSLSPISQVITDEQPLRSESSLVATDGSPHPLSHLDFDPNSYSTESITLAKSPTRERPSPSSPKAPTQYSQRKSNRQSIPLTFQDQQQAQFPHYPTVIPQNQRHNSSNARPSSTLYSKGSSGPSAGLPPRDLAYRNQSQMPTSQSNGLPRRTSSRGASAAMQAGVPSREGSHNDRSYRGGHHPHAGNGPLPPRKSSRGMASGALGEMVGNAESSRIAGPSNASMNGPPTGNAEWHDRGAAVGYRQEMDAEGRPIHRVIKKGVNDFIYGRMLGEGSYSLVKTATDRQTLKEYACKVLDKRHIIKEKKIKYVNIEKDALNRLTEHPGVVRLFYTFQDEKKLYFVLDLCNGGEMLGVLKKMGTFDVDCTRFYGAQVLDTIDFMHSRKVIHRDLKPENILLDDQMHVKVTDFGTAKILDQPARKASGSHRGIPLPETNRATDEDEEQKRSFVGTAEYVSPELLNGKDAGKASDLWAFGCIIYQLLSGRPPFKGGHEYTTFKKILDLDYKFPPGFPPLAKDLVERLLVIDSERRLTIDHIKNHEFFDGVKWGTGLWRTQAPRLRPYVPPSPESVNTEVNGTANGVRPVDSYPSNVQPAHSTRAAQIPPDPAPRRTLHERTRPSPRIITELPPPSQLDIEWSPVLTRNNERILKLGNLLVLTASGAHSPTAKNGDGKEEKEGNKFSRFFGAGTTKKRQRLVMVTSSARVIMTAPGGDEKKVKVEVSLEAPGTSWRKMQDSKGLAYWVLETRDKHYTFEDPKAATSDGSTTSATAQEWIDAIEHARDIALSQSMTSSYSADDAFPAGLTSSTTNLAHSMNHRDGRPNMMSRNTLRKGGEHEDGGGGEQHKGFKRFSKRQSKNGLAAVF